VDSVPEFTFGVSLASLLPHTIHSRIFRGSPTRVAYRLLDEAGYRFFQTLPLRGVTGNEWFAGPEWSWYKEDAWNAVDGFFQAFLRRDGEDMEPSTLIDWAAFPDSYEVEAVFERLAGRHVCHNFGEDWESRLVELNPGIEMTPYETAYKAWSEGYGLCLDTQHVLDLPKHYDPWFDDPIPFGQSVHQRIRGIDTVAPWVQLVHLKGVDGVHAEIVRRLLASPRLQPRIDIVAEFVPNPRMSEDQAIKHAKQFLASAKRLFRI
jgi:hypothetical protein